MSKTYLPYDPDQQLLLPSTLREWLPLECRVRPFRPIWCGSSMLGLTTFLGVNTRKRPAVALKRRRE